ncbi:unnamed protein product [Durusdinium trenchii]|uniref:C3H1-type domain-containing protein n=1 Tax=Durusdinium trenchii TaxID=1381693 RepID=A0ABP0HX30_9DINO
MQGYSGFNTATTGGAMAFALAPARSEARTEHFSYCPGETLKMTAALQIEQPLFWSGSSSDAIRPPPGLAPTVGAKAQSPMPAEPEPESRSDAENAPHSSAASTADTENIAGVHVASTVPSAEVPTRGSAGHGLGACKPCAFFYKDGCQSGFECAFCHLCPPGEKIRRKKELKQRRKLNKKQ